MLISCIYNKDDCYSYTMGKCKALASTDFESPQAMDQCPFYKEKTQREKELKNLKKTY